MLRESHSQTLTDGYVVVLEVTHLKPITINLLYSFIEAWLSGHAHSPWDLGLIQEVAKTPDHATHTYIRLMFQNAREATLFKLGPHMLYSRTSMPIGFLDSSGLIFY